ncbi:MAG: folate-binding protein YgfZ [Acidobacteria bacterium]|nr:folate-binding protein YgfZ [Acidobacteriota bacterium]
MNERGLVAELGQFALLRVEGADATQFLQNLFTNDVREVTAARSSLGALCTPNGRVIACARFVGLPGPAYLLRLPRELAAAVHEKLRGLVFRAKVALAIDDATSLLGVAGDAPGQALSALLPTLPESPGETAHAEGLAVVRVPGARPRFELYGERARIDALAAELRDGGAAGGGAAEWEADEIEAGLPEVYAANREAFLPQMLNLDLLGGLSFKKGCFPGQEVVARTQHLGEVKRRTYRARLDAPPPGPGTALRAVRAAGERDGGRVLRSAPDGRGGASLLAVIPVEIVEAGEPVHVAGGAGPRLALDSARP